MFKRGKAKLLGLVALTGLSSSAFAGQVFGQDITIDTAPVLAMAGIVISAIATIWAVKKVIALGNKS